MIVEREIAGLRRVAAATAPGARRTSTSRWAGSPGSTARTPRGAMQQATYDAVDEVGRATAEAGIDAGFHKGGEHPASRAARRASRPRGARSRSTSGSGSATATGCSTPPSRATRIRIAGAVRGARARTSAAVIHPGRLVRGLARAVERAGRRILEGTRRDRVPAAGRARAGRRSSRPRGEVRAPVVVLAGEAYLTELPPLHRQLIPLYSLIVLTEPRHGRPVGRDRLGEPRDRRLDPAVDRLPVADRGRPDPVRRPRRAVPLRRRRSAPSTTATARPTSGSGASSASGSRCSRDIRVHPRLGRAAGDAPRLAPDDRVRPGDGHRDGARLHRARRVRDEPRRAGC